jgi:hypothetical protein
MALAGKWWLQVARIFDLLNLALCTHATERGLEGVASLDPAQLHGEAP